MLFRDPATGKVGCLDDVCPHRGAPLSEGWVEKKNGHSCVVCPYHGWAFNEKGRLQVSNCGDVGSECLECVGGVAIGAMHVL